MTSSTVPLSDIDRSFALDPEFSFLLSLPAAFFDGSPPPLTAHDSSTPFSPYGVLPSIEAIDSANAQNSIRRSANFQQARARYEDNSRQQQEQPHMENDNNLSDDEEKVGNMSRDLAEDVNSNNNSLLLDTIWEDRQVQCCEKSRCCPQICRRCCYSVVYWR